MVKAQARTVRAALTDQSETHLRNAREELREENVEIALYRAIETMAEQFGDTETAKVAKQIRAEEERMARYLTGQIPVLVKDLVRSRVPRDQRRPAAGRTRRTARRTSPRARRATPARSG